MKIVLAEERGASLTEQSFNDDAIRIGREAGDCQFVFDGAQFPMVSRRHAELRRQNGQWFLHDLDSSYGTFIDGLRVSAPEAIKIGSRLQFGANGPAVRVVWLENAAPSQSFEPNALSNQSPPVRAANVAFPAPSDSPNISRQNQPAPSSKIAKLEFVDVPGPSAPFLIAKDSVWLGRDPRGDIVFEANAATVSRRHAEIRHSGGNFIIHDGGSFNGTLVNEQRIVAPTPLYHDDRIQLGIGGPVLKFDAPSRVAPEGASFAGHRSIAASQMVSPDGENIASGSTMIFNLGDAAQKISKDDAAQPQLLMSLAFGGKNELTIGRDERSDIKLDGLQISKRHARLVRTNAGIVVEDLNSTNGVYINGRRISRCAVAPDDAAQIGAFQIRVDGAGNIGVFDTRSKTRVDSINITEEIKTRAGGAIRLLDAVSLSIQPNEFVGLLGPSGAGKSTFINALNGTRPASSGSVLFNNLDLYQHLDSLKQSIGCVPQDDIIHRELTVYRTFYYIAKLRLSSDVSQSEINRIIEEVMDVTGLTERRDVTVNQLSGGQRKRVSIAVELMTKPSVIFLDEPTSGLDPGAEEKIMRLFRQIAESGRTVILTTHAMENVKLFDKIVILLRGKMTFYGKPNEALAYLSASSFKELYDKFEEPIERRIRQTGGDRQQITEQVAEEWKQKFIQTPQFKENVDEPLRDIGKGQSAGASKKRRLGLFGSIRQFATLSRRYGEVFFSDRLNLFILLAQAPIIATLIYLVMDANQPRDFAYFTLSLVAVWFGTSVSAREIIRERAVYRRERAFNLGLVPYLFSKIFVLGIIVGVQCLLLFAPLKFLDITGLMPMPGELFGIPQFWTMLLTAGVGIALGLLISALVKTSEMATSLVPLILIPQILFSGLVGIPTGANRVLGLLMPAAWSFDTMKRFSTLDTLEAEGAKAGGATNGLGLYKYIETENDKIISEAQAGIENYRIAAVKGADRYRREMEDYLSASRAGGNPTLPLQPSEIKLAPEIKTAVKIPENLSRYVTFLHPWMHEILNQIVLMLMFFILVAATLIALRLQDIG
jgi:ABC-type multidrug transport system ATPase subunit